MSLQGSPFTPTFIAFITAPDWMMSSARLRQIHRRVAKEAARYTMKKHKLDNLKDHFSPGNWTRYGHAPRKQSYIDWKRANGASPVNLVKRGRTKRHMEGQRGQLTVAGNADTTMTVKLKLSYPFPVSDKTDNKQGVNIDQMSKEITAWMARQEREAARNFQLFYLDFLEEELAKRKKLRQKLAGPMAQIRSDLG